MPFVMNFEVSGDVQIRRRLERFQLRSQDLTPAFEKMHTSFLAIERKQFDTQGASGSGGWKPNSPAWKKQKLVWEKSGKLHTDRYGSRKVVDHRILHMTQLLRKSLIQKSHPHHVTRIGPQEAFFGTNVFYAAHHQRPKNPSHRRRPVELTENQRRAWVRIVQKELIEE